MMKIGGLYRLNMTNNHGSLPVYAVRREEEELDYWGTGEDDNEVGLIKNGETFVLLDYRMFSKLVTIKVLTKDGIIGWIDVDQFSIKPYDEISSR